MPSNSRRLPFKKISDYAEFGQSDEPLSLYNSLVNLNENMSHLGIIWKQMISKLRSILSVKSFLFRQFLAEAFGTFFFISFGLGSVAQYVFAGRKSFLAVNLSFGLGLALAILVVGRISGGHLNPAVSLSMLLLGRIKFLKFLVFMLGQFLGSFFAALMVFVVYYDNIASFKNGMHSITTAGIFATYPTDLFEANLFNLFLDQFFSTALFIITILGVTDKRNNDLANEKTAFMIGISLTVIGTSFGYNCGFAVNPARDLAPRIFTSIAGWGWKPFTVGNYFFWIPVVAPFLGSILGTLLYSLFISNHWPDSNNAEDYDDDDDNEDDDNQY
ncbi:aquaporin-3 [Brachionus plicatilis]|uniref:Aquaporin-3 n=1 Tax=Brachionus plicatilis TaxID=10195 RepID=A0A3M7T0B6_BRAPC|nr:aquaporin-3 [Brachionus plicatilis]